MTQNIEHVLDSTGREILTVTADDQMGGVAINVIGIWYDHKQLAQLQDALTRADNFLNAQGVV